MKLVTGGATDVSSYFQMRLTAGGDATALTLTDFDLSYTRTGEATAAKVDATALAAATTAHTDNYGIEVDATDCPGLHRFDFPDAAFAAGAEAVFLTVKHTSCFTETLRVQIDAPVDAGIGAGSTGAINIKATEDNSSAAIIDSVTKVGTITGDFNNVHADTGGSTIISIADVGNDIDFVLGYDVGGARTGASVQIVANLNGNADSMTVEAYDHVGAGWDIIGILSGSGGAAYVAMDVPLYTEHTGTGSELGKVYIRFDNNATTPALLEIDRCSVSAVNTSTSVGYADGAYWVSSTGTSGQEVGTNGTADNPCPWADAVAMNATQALSRFHIAANTSITLSATAANYSFLGQAYSVALCSQDIDGAFFFGANVTGIGTWTSTHPIFEDCPIGTVTLPPSIMRRCFLSGTITASAAGDFYLNHCVSRIAGASSPAFDFGGAVGNTSLNMRLYSGGIQLESMGDTGTDTASIEGFGQVIEGTCTGGNVTIRGNMTLSGVTNITFSDDARIDVGQINAQCDTALSDYDGPTKAELDTGLGLLATEAKQDTMQTAVTTILADTNELQTDWTDNGRLDLILDDILLDTGTTLPGILTVIGNYVDTEVAAIKAVTDNLPDSGALTSIAQATALSTAQTAITAIKAITDAIGATAAAALAKTLGSAGVINFTVDTSAFSPTTTEFEADDITEATAEHYKDRTVLWLTGALAGQMNAISDYALSGANGHFTVSAMTEAPANNVTGVIL